MQGTKYILVFDIGATNCRMAVFAYQQAKTLTCLEHRVVATKDIHTEQDLYAAYSHGFGQKYVLAGAVASVAGVIMEGNVQLSNADLTLTQRQCSILFGHIPFILVNDFTAVSYALESKLGREAERVYGASVGTGPMRAVLGAGTGLGCAMVFASAQGNIILPSEGGHMAFAFVGAEEEAYAQAYMSFLQRSWLTGDDIISGRGIEFLARYLLGEELTAAEVSARFLQHSCRLQEMLATFYARACRNWVLATLCQGGLWLAGSVAMKNPNLIKSAAFAKEFVQGVHSDFLRTIPIYLFTDETYGLWGAAHAAIHRIKNLA